MVSYTHHRRLVLSGSDRHLGNSNNRKRTDRSCCCTHLLARRLYAIHGQKIMRNGQTNNFHHRLLPRGCTCMGAHDVRQYSRSASGRHTRHHVHCLQHTLAPKKKYHRRHDLLLLEVRRINERTGKKEHLCYWHWCSVRGLLRKRRPISFQPRRSHGHSQRRTVRSRNRSSHLAVYDAYPVSGNTKMHLLVLARLVLACLVLTCAKTHKLKHGAHNTTRT